jgi:hypothetical protein
MKIIIKELYGANGFDYSKQCEQCLGDILKNIYNITCEGYTEGYNPEYDFLANGKKIEVKFTSKTYPHIEFARYNKQPSGLLLSKSDYYLTVSPGGSNGKFVGKIRLYKINNLKKYLIESLLSQIEGYKTEGLDIGKLHIYNPSHNSPGSICFIMEPKKIEDMWLGDCELIMSDKNIIGFDMDTFSKSYINNIIL